MLFCLLDREQPGGNQRHSLPVFPDARRIRQLSHLTTKMARVSPKERLTVEKTGVCQIQKAALRGDLKSSNIGRSRPEPRRLVP
jgi:hypothetical protein